jgi:hypothetical protein
MFSRPPREKALQLKGSDDDRLAPAPMTAPQINIRIGNVRRNHTRRCWPHRRNPEGVEPAEDLVVKTDRPATDADLEKARNHARFVRREVASDDRCALAGAPNFEASVST